MPEQILSGLYRLPIPLEGNPLKELNAYLIKGADRSLLIDTGFRRESCRQALFSQLAELGLRPGEVDVLCTHLHSDHTGLAPDAAGENRTVYISGEDSYIFSDEDTWRAYWRTVEARFLEEGFPPELMEHMWETNPAHSMAPPRETAYVSLKDGDVLEAGGFRLRCLSVPGHTPGQLCFWLEEQGAMLLGDHVLFDITPNITTWNTLPDALGHYLDSLKKIRAYDVALPLPGHRGRGDLKARVDALLDHHRFRLEETRQAVKNHPGLGAYYLAGYLTWSIRAKSRDWADFPLTQKWFAVGECMSHLERLEAEGAIRREVRDGLALYYTV